MAFALPPTESQIARTAEEMIAECGTQERLEGISEVVASTSFTKTTA